MTDNRMNAMDDRFDAIDDRDRLVAEADLNVVRALEVVREDLTRERRERKQGLIIQAVVLAVAGLMMTTVAVLIVYQASCRTVTDANRTTLTVLNALLDSADKRDRAILPPKEYEEIVKRREESRRVGTNLLYPDAC